MGEGLSTALLSLLPFTLTISPCFHAFIFSSYPIAIHPITLPAQFFVAREVSPDFDMEVYNKMITEVQHNPKFSEYFVPSQ